MQEVVNIAPRKKIVVRRTALIFLGLVVLLTFFSRTINNFLIPVVEVESPMRGTLEKSINAKGVVKIINVKKVYASGTWKVKEIKVSKDGEIARGDVLMVVDAEDVLVDLKKNELAITNAKINLEKFKSSFIRVEQPSYQYSAEQALRTLKACEKELETVTLLNKAGAESDLSVETERNKLEDSKNDYDSKCKIIEQKKLEYTLELKRMELDLETKQLDFERFKKNFPQNGDIRSDYEGTVKTINVEPGEITAQGQILFELVPKGEKLSVQWLLNTAKASDLVEGDSVSLEVTGYEKSKLYGTVTAKEYIAKDGMFQYTSEVKGDIPTDLSVGQEVSVASSKTSTKYPMVISNSALMTDNGTNCVFVLKQRQGALGEENYVEKVTVNVAEKDDFKGAISGDFGLEDKIVTYSSKALLDKAQVKLR